MEMQQIRYFIGVADTLNFTRAADRCGVSQPSLTRAIQQLEAELGGPLFHRERRNTHLTELGQVMRPFLQSVLEKLEQARSEAEAYRRIESAPLRIGAMCTVGPAIIADFILKFHAAYPNVELIVSDCTARSLMDRMLAGDLSLALMGAPTEFDPHFHVLPLFAERFVIAVSRNHHFANHAAIRSIDLHDQAYINRANCEYFEFARAEFRSRGAFLRRVFSSERDDWVQGMIRAGMGFGFIPEFCVTDPELVVLPLTDPEFVRTIGLVTMRGRPHSPAVGAFVNEARKFKWPQSPDTIGRGSMGEVSSAARGRPASSGSVR